jgi:hypothetical protein
MQKNQYEMTERATAQIEIDFLRDEVKRLKIQSKDVSVARELLKRNGYYVNNLWTTGDVTQNYNCSDEVAYEVLDRAMHNDATMQQIFLAIDDVCDDLEIKKIND